MRKEDVFMYSFWGSVVVVVIYLLSNLFDSTPDISTDFFNSCDQYKEGTYAHYCNFFIEGGERVIKYPSNIKIMNNYNLRIRAMKKRPMTVYTCTKFNGNTCVERSSTPFVTRPNRCFGNTYDTAGIQFKGEGFVVSFPKLNPNEVGIFQMYWGKRSIC